MAIQPIGNAESPVIGKPTDPEFARLLSASATDDVQLAQANGATDRTTIRVVAPYTGSDGRGNEIPRNDATIEIEVRELRGEELGDLYNRTPAQIEVAKDAAAFNKNNEDRAAYDRTTDQLKDEAIESGYFNSPAHNAWAMAAEARTGGLIDAAWWKEFDPFGGTAGNGPEILATGEYPGAASQIAMAHDTDWSLGRHFGAGPLSALQGADESADVLGRFGLTPLHRLGGVDLYSNGHPDWDVTYAR